MERVEGGEQQGRWETSVMKCEICLWRRWGICEGAGNQELCGRNDMGDVCVGLQAVVFQPAVTSLPPLTARKPLFKII